MPKEEITLGTLYDTLQQHGRRFDDIDNVLKEHGKRFDSIESTLREHDKRFDSYDKRFDAMEASSAPCSANWSRCNSA